MKEISRSTDMISLLCPQLRFGIAILENYNCAVQRKSQHEGEVPIYL